MPVNVGQCFLNNAVNGDLYLGQKPVGTWRTVKLDLNIASLREASYKPGKSRLKSGLIQHRRMQQIRYRTDLTKRSCDKRAALGNSVLNLIRAIRKVLFQGGKVDIKQYKILCRLVVKLASETPLLFVLDLQKPRHQLAQLALFLLPFGDIAHVYDNNGLAIFVGRN